MPPKNGAIQGRIDRVKLIMLALTAISSSLHAAVFDITRYGATAGDDSDDTKAIVTTLKACGDAGGGTVFIPAGTFIVKRQGSESPILELPSNTTLRGEGGASVMKFAPDVKDFWRLIGAAKAGCHHSTICDLHLDGSNTHSGYDKGKTPEHNEGVFLYTKTGAIEDVTICNLLAENFTGDCIAIGRGCRNITIRNVTVRNFIRQGIQLGGDENARDYLVTGCQDLEGSVEAGGSTIHVEHANGLRDVIITANRCRHSLLAGGVKGLILRDNVVNGRMECNSNTNAIVEGNVINGLAEANRPLMQFGYANGLVVRGNILSGGGDDQTGIYVWGSSRYNPEPSKQVIITDNLIRGQGQPISLNGVHGGTVRGNVSESALEQAKQARCEDVNVDTARSAPFAGPRRQN